MAIEVIKRVYRPSMTVGQVYVAPYGSDALKPIGNVLELGLAHAEDVQKQPDMTQLGGAEHIGMGSDFDGIETHPEGLEHAGCVYALLDRMRTRGFSAEAVEGFAGENLRKYLQKL